MRGSSLVVVEGDAPVQIMDEWNDARREFIRKNFCAGAPDQYVEPFLMLCERRNLSPEAKHIYLVPRNNKNKDGSYTKVWTPQTSIDGYRLIADRTGKYAGSDEPVFVEDSGKVTKATVTVYKLVSGVRCPFTASAYWAEYYPGERQGRMWDQMPHVMLAKVAESAALRKAFPEDLSGMYTDEEMAQAGPSTVQEVERPATPRQEQPVAANVETGEIIDADYTEEPAPAPQQTYAGREDKPTTKQMNFLGVLISKMGWSDTEGRAVLKQRYDITSRSQLTYAQGKDLIDWLVVEVEKKEKGDEYNDGKPY